MAFEKVKEIIKTPPTFTYLTDLAQNALAAKYYSPPMIFLQKKKISSNPAGEFLLQTNIPTVANGWTAGKAAASVHPATTGQ
jgi:hypothetical protein